MKTYKYSYPVTLGDIDSNYYITSNSILCLFQDAIARFLSSGHVAMFDVKDDNLIWMITDFDASIKEKKVFWSSQTNVEVWISELTTFKVFVDFKVTDANDVVFAEGSSSWLLYDFIERKPYQCRKNKNLLNLYDESYAIHHKKTNIQKPGSYLESLKHTINAMEVDFNGHTNNQNYFKVATSMIPSNYLENYYITSLQIKFVQQSYLGDELEFSLLKHDEDFFSVVIAKNNGTSLVCRITTIWNMKKNKVDIRKELSR